MGPSGDLGDLDLLNGYGPLLSTGRRIRCKGTDISFTVASPQGRYDNLLIARVAGHCSI